jgi:hypothetical protein
MIMLKSAKVLFVAIIISIFVFSGLKCGYTPGFYQAFEPTVKFGQVKNNANAQYSSIIRLKTMFGDGFCSGFVIDGSYAITAAHCVDYLKKDAQIKIYDKKNKDTGTIAKVLGFNQRNDSAVITGDFKDFQAIPFEKYTNGFYSDKYQGLLKICGYPYDQKYLYCSDAKAMEPHYFGMRLLGSGIPGMSGGPTVHFDTGVALGVNSHVDGPFLVVFPLTGILSSFGLE